MPYASEAQRKFFHTNTAKKKGITSSMVQEYDQASKGMTLKDHVKKAKKSSTKAHQKQNK